jgi:DNA-directed RNA polymerase specialized sigma24 family protein
VRQYSPALKLYLQTKFGFDSSTADDFVQGFLVDKVLKRDLIARVREEKGKFRTFLATAIHRWAIDRLRREQSKKRSPENGFVTLDAVRENDLAVPVEDVDQFDNIFVRQVLASAVHRLNQYCATHERAAAWTVFYHRVLFPALDGDEPKPYTELVEELGLNSAVEARNLLLTAKRIFRRELETVVREYSNDSAELEEELDGLRKLLQ